MKEAKKMLMNFIMKKLMLMMMFLCLSVVAMAQDKIVKRDGMHIYAKDVHVKKKVVEYKRYDDTSNRVQTINISELLAINFENGETITFDSAGNARKSNNTLVDNGNRTLTDAELIALSHGDEKPKIKRELTPQEKLYRKGKRMNIAGWMVGGSLVAGGITLITLGFADCLGMDKWRLHKTPYTEHEDRACACSKLGMATGIPTIAVGAGLGALLIHNGQKIMQQASKVQSTTLLQYELPLGTGSVMTADINLLTDNLIHRYSPGLGFQIHF